MNTVEDIRSKFLQIYERIVDKRGLPIIYGRIMAIFFLEGRELNQKELSDLTEYSISSISRAVDQMTKMGILIKHKNPSREYFLYQMHLNFLDLAINGLQTWIHQAMESKREISHLIDDIDINKIDNDNKNEVAKYKQIISNLEKEIKAFIKLINESVNHLKGYRLNHNKN
jgi:DNA-binding transcriptional regulator GbsR (MarR family)